MFQRKIRIITRKSALALWQAEFVKQKIQEVHPILNIEIQAIHTAGDKLLDIPLHKTGGKGLFVKELDDALLKNLADIAVHSMKDVPADHPDDLEIIAILEREDPRDAFVSNQVNNFFDLAPQAIVGTSSLRRQAQLAAKRPDLRYEYLRGNVDTRVRKLDQNQFDAIILAVAGLKRLNLSHRISAILEPEWMIPCVGQGALAIQCRKEDFELKKMLEPFNHLPSSLCISAERSMNQSLGGNCQLPVGGLATMSKNGTEIRLSGMVGLPDGSRIIQTTASDSIQNCIALGKRVAEQLFNQGAKEIMDACG